MTDKQFNQLLKKTAKAGNKYLTLYRQAEHEYERRYGDNPSDIDDDFWIDSLTCAAGKMKEGVTVKEIENVGREQVNRLRNC